MQSRQSRPYRGRQYRGAGGEEREWRRAAWTMFWFLAIGKLITAVALAAVGLMRLDSAQRTLSVVVLLNWSWVVLAIVLVAGPTIYWWRLRRVRRKRAALIHAEWNVDDDHGSWRRDAFIVPAGKGPRNNGLPRW